VSTGFMQNHTNYFNDGNPALANMADVVSGNSDAVLDTGGRTQEAHDYLYDWVGSEAQHHVVQPVVDTYEGVRDGVVQTYEGVRDGVVETYEGVRDGVGDAVDGARDAWDDLWPDHWP
jgi:hypothetical protein